MRELKLTALINIGPYSHVTAELIETLPPNQNPFVLINAWKKAAVRTLGDTAETTEEIREVTPTEPEVKVEEVKVEEPKVEEVKEKKTRAKKEKAVVEEVKVEAKKTIFYDRNVEAHRQMLSAYLTKEHPTWKTKEGIKEFSASLVGKEFLDDEGMIVESFKKLVSEFFA